MDLTDMMTSVRNSASRVKRAGLMLVAAGVLAACTTGDDADRASDSTSATPEKTARQTRPRDASTLRINDAGLAIIKKSEGLRLKAYSLGGRQYIGYGHQMAPGEPSRITQAQADKLLRLDVQEAEAGVRRMLEVPVTENQFSAMVSLAYNLGTGGFSRTNVLANVNDGDIADAADSFLLYVKAGGRVLAALERRRAAERALFLTP